MSSGVSSKEIRGGPGIQSYPAANNNTNNFERQTSMSVDYLTRTQHNRDHPSYDINNHFIYPQPLMQQGHNMPPQQQQQQAPPQHRGTYDRPPTGPPHPAGSIQTTSSSASSNPPQAPRITLPPLSAITDNQETQTDGASGQASQTVTASPGQPNYPPQPSQQQQQQSQPQSQPQQQPQHQPQPQSQPPQQQQPLQPSSTYSSRPTVPPYESQQGLYQHPQRHLQPSPQLPPDQSRYASGPVIPQTVPLQPHQMGMNQLQANPMGTLPSPSPTPTHFPPTPSQYVYTQPQYPPQPMYGQYPPPQIPPPMPPGIPYQPAYATSHRQRPPQFNQYPPPHPPPPSQAGFAPPPQGAPQGWPQDYIAQPLTPLTAHSPQQPYSPQLQPASGPGGPLRVRRTSLGLPQPPYPPPPGEPQPASQSQPALKPKRKRATSGQLQVLNRVFASTFFPSTELRIALGKELNMSPRTVQIWFQNKRQSWRSMKLKPEQGGSSSQQKQSSTTAASGGAPQTTQTTGSFSPHPLRQEQFTSSTSSHTRIPSTAEDGAREEGMENDEGGGWEALRQAQQESRDYQSRGTSGDPEEDEGFADDGEGGPHQHAR